MKSAICICLWVVLTSFYVLYQEKNTQLNDAYATVLDKKIECNSKGCNVSISESGDIETSGADYVLKVQKSSTNEIGFITVGKDQFIEYQVHNEYNFGKPRYSIVFGFSGPTLIAPPNSDFWFIIRFFNVILIFGFVLLRFVDSEV